MIKMGWSERVCQCDEFVKGNDYLCAVCRLLPPAPQHLKVGDRLTIAGKYQRRTFWEWLTRQPRQLQQYRVKDTAP